MVWRWDTGNSNDDKKFGGEAGLHAQLFVRSLCLLELSVQEGFVLINLPLISPSGAAAAAAAAAHRFCYARVPTRCPTIQPRPPSRPATGGTGGACAGGRELGQGYDNQVQILYQKGSTMCMAQLD